MDKRWLGIDFSGDRSQWGTHRRRSNVWIAELRSRSGRLVLGDLRRVQELPGTERPFLRLAALLGEGAYAAAGIDAPFGVPAAFLGAGGQAGLLGLVSALPAEPDFPAAIPFVTAVAGRPPPLKPPKPLRATEQYWAQRGVHPRSPLWAGKRAARPGAPMTAACLRLLHLAGRPLWPWSLASGALAEAFPAAQLATWKLPHRGYSGEGRAPCTLRCAMVEAVGQRVALGPYRQLMERTPDALDAVLAAFAAVAVTTGEVEAPPGPLGTTEGWIAVHR